MRQQSVAGQKGTIARVAARARRVEAIVAGGGKVEAGNSAAVFDGGPAPGMGPKMRALPNDRWREFVRQHVARPRGFHAANMRAAGFKATQTKEALRVGAWKLLQDVRIQEAVLEETRVGMVALGPLGLHAVEKILAGKDGTAADRGSLSMKLFDRIGLHGVQEHRHVGGQYIGDDPERIRRIEAMCEMLGISAAALLGQRLAAQPVDVTPAIEHEVADG